MCGIAGKLYLHRDRKVEDGLILKMCDQLKHRGPDDHGIYEDHHFAFGMRRLSIIDIDSGHQPMFNEDRTLGVVFNGEIYNYQTLRAELQKQGHQFLSQSDTEVILHAYEEYGLGFVHKLNGMFAIALWDIRHKKLLLVRDRLGIKPLYYFANDQQLVFGSELKAVLADPSISRSIDPQALDLYLSYMYVPAPWTMFSGVKKLPAGHCLICEDSQVQIKPYWDVSYQKHPAKFTREDYADQFRDMLKDSVRLRMISDVPLGAFLSGGIDSSAVVALMSQLSDKPVKTFSIGFKGGGYHDETSYAQRIAECFGTDHTVLAIDDQEAHDLQDYVRFFDEPFADYAAFPTYIVSKLARQHVKVVLTGDGCDEIFAGYERYHSEHWAQVYKKLPTPMRNSLIAPLLNWGKSSSVGHERMHVFFQNALKKTQLMNLPDEHRYIQGFWKFNEEQKQLLLQRSYWQLQCALNAFAHIINQKSDFDFLGRRLYLDTKTSLPEDMLTKVDRVSMATSLEARVPFLDHRLVEWAARLPSSLKMDHFQTKTFVRYAVKDWLPKDIIQRPKHGFSLPMDQWLRGHWKKQLQNTLSPDRIADQGIFQPQYIQQLVNDHLDSKVNVGAQLFMLMIFVLWFEEYSLNPK